MSLNVHLSLSLSLSLSHSLSVLTKSLNATVSYIYSARKTEEKVASRNYTCTRDP